MPIYEFICTACGKKFEELCRSTEPEGIKCPACGGSQVSRQMSSFACKGPGGGCGSCGGGSCSSCHH